MEKTKSENVSFNYFTATENEQYLFLQLPLALIKDEYFKELSNDAKILYSLLLNRTSLSAKNGWLDHERRVYVIYTIEEMMGDLNCWKQKTTKLMKELKEIGLVKTIRQGLTKPNLIYVMNFATNLKYNINKAKEEKAPETSENTGKNENHTSRISTNKPQKFRRTNPSNINHSKKEYIDNNISIYQDPIKPQTLSQTPIDMIDNSQIENINTTTNRTPEPDIVIKTYTKEEVADKLAINEIKENCADKQDEVNMLYDIVCEVLTDTNPVKPTLRIAKQNIPFTKVKHTFDKLTQNHIQYVLHCLNHNNNKHNIVSNTKSYLMTSLFNSTHTIDFYYNHSFAKQSSPNSSSSSFNLDNFFQKAVQKAIINYPDEE